MKGSSTNVGQMPSQNVLKDSDLELSGPTLAEFDIFNVLWVSSQLDQCKCFILCLSENVWQEVEGRSLQTYQNLCESFLDKLWY